jgi:hypothetical protein
VLFWLIYTEPLQRQSAKRPLNEGEQMTATALNQIKPATWQLTLGSEGIAAAQFARCGLDVSVQSGRDKPWYDLVVAKAGNLLKVSVKGSDDGQWALVQSYMKRAAGSTHGKKDFHEAIDQWLDHLGSRAICCLIQFHGVALHQLPRIYLASPHEIAETLRVTVNRLGCSILHESYEWASATEGTLLERLPSNWAFSEQRIQELLTREVARAISQKPLLNGNSPVAVWPAVPGMQRNNRTGVAVRA